MAKFLNIVFLIFFVAIIIIFTAENPELVSVKFLSLKSINLPISVIVFVSVILGIIIGLVYHFYSVYKIKKELKNEKNDMA